MSPILLSRYLRHFSMAAMASLPNSNCSWLSMICFTRSSVSSSCEMVCIVFIGYCVYIRIVFLRYSFYISTMFLRYSVYIGTVFLRYSFYIGTMFLRRAKVLPSTGLRKYLYIFPVFHLLSAFFSSAFRLHTPCLCSHFAATKLR